MSRDLNDLSPNFQAEVNDLIRACQLDGVVMTPYYTARNPTEQAVLWRQSRTINEINNALSEMTSNGAHFLANILDQVGSQFGNHVTNALPGLSWHQWGEAVDCFWNVDNSAQWSTRVGGSQNGYRIYANNAARMGLTAGGLWNSFKDWPHVQQRSESSPLHIMSWSDIDAKMSTRWG